MALFYLESSTLAPDPRILRNMQEMNMKDLLRFPECLIIKKDDFYWQHLRLIQQWHHDQHKHLPMAYDNNSWAFRSKDKNSCRYILVVLGSVGNLVPVLFSIYNVMKGHQLSHMAYILIAWSLYMTFTNCWHWHIVVNYIFLLLLIMILNVADLLLFFLPLFHSFSLSHTHT